MFELGSIAHRLQSDLCRVGAAGADAAAADWVDLAGSCQQLINMVGAMQTVALAHLAATEDVVRDDGTIEEEFRGLGHQRLDAPALVHDLLGLTASAATDRVATAVDLVTRHPTVVEVMRAGRLDVYRAGIVAEELAEASREVCAEVVDQIGTHLGTEAGGALRRRTRRVLARVDADLLRRKAERARAERSLRRCAFAPGVDEWSAKVPVEESRTARTAWSVVDGLARRYLTEGRCAGIEQARADALMDLIHARATGEVTVHLTVPASEVAAEAARVADSADLVPVTGFGMPGVTHVRASWVTSMFEMVMSPRDANASSNLRGAGSRRGRGRGRALDVVACDDTTGALMSLPVSVQSRRRERRDIAASLGDTVAGASDHGRYRPPPGMIEFVKARDGQCRFPGCAINARFCDVDHVVPWPVGASHPTNLVCLCRRHHRIKQRPRWSARLDPDGTLVWTDPTDRRRTTLPLDHLQRGTTAAPGVMVASGDSTPTVNVDVDATLPSLLEETFDHQTAGHLVELACTPPQLTTRNRRALRSGARVSTNRVVAKLSAGEKFTLEVIRPCNRLDSAALLTHRHLRSSRPNHAPGDDPPPF